MPRPFLFSRSLRFLLLFVLFTASSTKAQTPPGSRVTQPVDDHVRVTLQGNVHPLAQLQFDQGAVPDAFPVERMLLILQRPPDRELALRQFLQDAHTPSNPSFHQWLKPEQFAALYGSNDADIAA